MRAKVGGIEKYSKQKIQIVQKSPQWKIFKKWKKANVAETQSMKLGVAKELGLHQ